MNTPVSFKLSSNKFKEHKPFGDWLHDNNLLDKVTYDWHKALITFECKEDAVAFSLTYGIEPYETTLDKMIKEANDN